MTPRKILRLSIHGLLLAMLSLLTACESSPKSSHEPDALLFFPSPPDAPRA